MCIRDRAYLPQESSIFGDLTVSQNLYGTIQLIDQSNDDEVKNIIEKFQLTNILDKTGRMLSGGERRKTEIARMLFTSPDLVLLDEPFSGFDPINANIIKDEILDLRIKGATIIFSTHRMESVEELCEDIALINKSNKILDGNLDEIKTKFKSNI